MPRHWLLALITAVVASALAVFTSVPPVSPALHAPSDQAIYTDALAGGWDDWSWDTTRDFANTSPVQGGTASIAVTFNAAWAGLYLHAGTPIATGGYDSLRFWVHGGAAGGQTIQVSLNFDTSNAYAFTPQADTWTLVDIPLADLGGPAEIVDLVWQEQVGHAQPVFYLDTVALISATGTPTPTPPPGAGPALSVDAAAGQHAISPYIYGMNFADEDLAAELRLPVRRWGGNATTRYNWQNDTSNRAMDWYYENIPNDNPNPAILPDGSATDLFVEQDRRTGTQTLLTVPLIGWTPKARAYDCGFSVTLYGAQQSVDPWRPDCGNGVHTDGTLVTGNDPLDTSVAITPAFVQQWMQHLIGKYGNAASGGVRFYNLDNEPMLWYDTHRDVHPDPTSYDELRDRTLAYAAAIKATDPNAQTVGPAVWGWTAYFWSALDWESGGNWWEHPQDRLAHGDIPFLEWYLGQLRAYEQQHGVRLLDYLDAHFYPQATGVFSTEPGSAAVQALRLRSTRALWDPTYVDESWIGQAVYLIPRMHGWVDDNYPNTRLAIGEYNWGAGGYLNGALAQADVLGIFGREGLDLATLWGPPAADDPAAYAFRMYRNYDGAGSAFGDIGVQAASADQGQLAIYAAQRGSDLALTLMIVNETGAALTSQVTLAGFAPALVAQVYRYSDAHLHAIVRAADQPVTASGFTATFPANSITLVVIPTEAGTLWRVALPAVMR